MPTWLWSMPCTVLSKINVMFSHLVIVLLDVVCGRKYVQIKAQREFLEKPVEEEIDPNIKGKIVPDCWQVFIDIMVRCWDYEPDEHVDFTTFMQE